MSRQYNKTPTKPKIPKQNSHFKPQMLSVQTPPPVDVIIKFSCYLTLWICNSFPFPFLALPTKWVLWTLPDSNSKNRWLELFLLFLAEEGITVLKWGLRASSFWLGTRTASTYRRENLEEDTSCMRWTYCIQPHSPQTNYPEIKQVDFNFSLNSEDNPVVI